MKKMTEKFAIAETKKLWKEIEKSGLSKADFLWGTKQGRKWLNKHYLINCPLCEYDSQFKYENLCSHCPLVEKYKVKCIGLGYSPEMNLPKQFFKAIRDL